MCRRRRSVCFLNFDMVIIDTQLFLDTYIISPLQLRLMLFSYINYNHIREEAQELGPTTLGDPAADALSTLNETEPDAPRLLARHAEVLDGALAD